MSSTPPPPPQKAEQFRSRPLPSTALSAQRSTVNRKGQFPLSITHPFRPNSTSTSVAPSTAEGRAIPVDGTTAEHRTSALRELNSHYPSRHRYAKSTGSQSSTYSEPVIVRSYYSPAPTRHDKSSRRRPGRGGAGSEVGGPGIGTARSLSFANKVPPVGNGMLSTMVRACHRKISEVDVNQGAHLPPVEAFSFKSFLANIEAQLGGNDINSDLDKIAEICARSRYSLSSQYEVHHAPHGSGSSFMASQSQEHQGPTLQAVISSGEQDLSSTTRRRGPVGRRNSRAMGTLETIISSSRSSDEEKSERKSASELAAKVRGRTVIKAYGRPSSPTSSVSRRDVYPRDGSHEPRTPVRPPSTPLALLDTFQQNGPSIDASTLCAPSPVLVSIPALPQPLSYQLEAQTAMNFGSVTPKLSDNDVLSPHQQVTPDAHLARGSMLSVPQENFSSGFFSTINGWLSWATPSSRLKPEGRAESSLRNLLYSTELKRKKSLGPSVD